MNHYDPRHPSATNISIVNNNVMEQTSSQDNKRYSCADVCLPAIIDRRLQGHGQPLLRGRRRNRRHSLQHQQQIVNESPPVSSGMNSVGENSSSTINSLGLNQSSSSISISAINNFGLNQSGSSISNNSNNLSANLKPKKETKKKGNNTVSFSMVHVYEFGYVMGDNPSVSEGVPVSMGMTAHSHRTLEVAKYEMYFPSACRRREKTGNLKLGVAERAKLLLRAGYTMAEIVDTTLSVKEDKRRRYDSIRQRRYDEWNALVEKTTRKLRKVAGVGTGSAVDDGSSPGNGGSKMMKTVLKRVIVSPAKTTASVLLSPTQRRNRPALRRHRSRRRHSIGSTVPDSDGVDVAIDGEQSVDPPTGRIWEKEDTLHLSVDNLEWNLGQHSTSHETNIECDLSEKIHPSKTTQRNDQEDCNHPQKSPSNRPPRSPQSKKAVGGILISPVNARKTMTENDHSCSANQHYEHSPLLFQSMKERLKDQKRTRRSSCGGMVDISTTNRMGKDYQLPASSMRSPSLSDVSKWHNSDSLVSWKDDSTRTAMTVRTNSSSSDRSRTDSNSVEDNPLYINS